MSLIASQITSLTIVLLNRLFTRRSKKTSNLHVIGLCVVNSPMAGELPAQMFSNAENVSIWWRHHDTVHEPLEAFTFSPLCCGCCGLESVNFSLYFRPISNYGHIGVKRMFRITNFF